MVGHGAAVVAASGFSLRSGFVIGLTHLHNQTVRVHNEEVLLSERGYGLCICREEF